MKKITLILLTCLVCVMAQAETPVTPPDGVEPEMYKFKGHDTYIDKDKEAEVFVVRDGNDIFIQGLSINFMPSGWVKGMLADGVATFPEAYMGAFDFWGESYDLYFDGAVFTYDETTNTFTATDGYTTTAEETVLDEYINVTLTGVVATPATPATPEITAFTQDNYGYYVEMNIPTVDVEGNDLFPSLLSYELLYEKPGETGVFEFTTDDYIFIEENMTQVPYNYTDSYDIDKAGKQVYLYADDLETWSLIGVKSIYTVGDVVNESEVFWFATPFGLTAIEDIADSPVVATRYYDLQGREVDAAAKGLIIQVTRLADGTTHAVKVVK